MPIALGSVIYVLAQDGGMFAVKPDHGTQIWSSPDPSLFVSASPDRVYTINRFGRLAILDAKTGARVDTMPLPQMIKPLLNDQSDRLLLYTDRGFIQCLHEAKLTEPHLYIAPPPQVKAKNAPPPAAKPAEAPPAAAEPAAAPAAEPMPEAAGG
jgi:hypothetical protein